MSTQLSLFDTLRATPIIRPVVPHGHVVQGEPHHTFRLPHRRGASDVCRIELHQDDCGLWMWSTHYACDNGSGGGYKVGAKWGKFAHSRDDALSFAVDELRERLGKIATPDKSVAKILQWAGSLTLGAFHG